MLDQIDMVRWHPTVSTKIKHGQTLQIHSLLYSYRHALAPSTAIPYASVDPSGKINQSHDFPLVSTLNPIPLTLPSLLPPPSLPLHMCPISSCIITYHIISPNHKIKPQSPPQASLPTFPTLASPPCCLPALPTRTHAREKHVPCFPKPRF